MGLPISGRELLTKMHQAGLVPQQVSRAVLDIPLDGAVRLYIECRGDQNMLDIEIPEMLQDALVIRIDEPAEETNGN